MRRGVRIGVDPGSVRVGVSRSDPEGMLAVPVATLRRGHGDVDGIAAIAAEHDAIEVIVGHPISLGGAEGRAGAAARAYAAELAGLVSPIPVRLVDERLSTAAAARRVAAAGRSERRARAILDQEAAVGILQQALDAERSTGIPAGTEVRTP